VAVAEAEVGFAVTQNERGRLERKGKERTVGIEEEKWGGW